MENHCLTEPSLYEFDRDFGLVVFLCEPATIQRIELKVVMSEGNLPISRIDTFLVHPGKGNAKAKESNGASLPLKGDLYHMLKAVYERSESECDIGISFNHSKDGTQTNPVRSLISDYLGSRTIPKGRKLANRLRDSTNGVSGLGLLFLVSGKENGKNKIVISFAGG